VSVLLSVISFQNIFSCKPETYIQYNFALFATNTSQSILLPCFSSVKTALKHLSSDEQIMIFWLAAIHLEFNTSMILFTSEQTCKQAMKELQIKGNLCRSS
jgi:hypothetical protein